MRNIPINNKRILDGTTGFNPIDNLSMEDRLKLIEQRKQFQQNLTQAKRTELWKRYYEIIRQKQKEYNGRLRSASETEILQEYYKQDVPRQLAQMMKDLEKEATAIVNPAEQAEFRQQTRDLIAPLLAMYRNTRGEGREKK